MSKAKGKETKETGKGKAKKERMKRTVVWDKMLDALVKVHGDKALTQLMENTIILSNDED